MKLKELFNSAARWVDFAKRVSVFKAEAAKTDIHPDQIDNVMEMFEKKQNTFREFVQNNSDESSIVFAENLDDNFSNSPQEITSWQTYFDIIKDNIEELQELGFDKEDGFLGQLEYRTKLFEEYYQSQSKTMCKLLDIFASKGDIQDLCDKTPVAQIAILNKAVEKLNNQNPKPNM